MRHTDVLKAIGETERFLRSAEEYKVAYAPLLIGASVEIADITSLKERAALRRASLDLTRALAKMRRKG